MIILIDHTNDCLAAITGERSHCNCRKPKEPEQVWCSRCGALYPKATYEGDGDLWKHLGPLMGLGHYCNGRFNAATNVPPQVKTGAQTAP